MNNYPEWLPDNLKEKYERLSNQEVYGNAQEYVLLLHNPNYENIGRYSDAGDKMKVGETYVLGRAHMSGDLEGHISWREFTPSSLEEISRALYPGIWYVMKKKEIAS